jgi:hypothetical protein
MPIWDTAHTFPEQYVRPRRHPDLLGNSDLTPISLIINRSTIMATELLHPFVAEIRVVHTLFALSAWLSELSRATEGDMRLGEEKKKWVCIWNWLSSTMDLGTATKCCRPACVSSAHPFLEPPLPRGRAAAGNRRQVQTPVLNSICPLCDPSVNLPLGLAVAT